MKHYLLKNNEAVPSGFTDLFILTHEDLTAAVDNTDQEITLTTLKVGDILWPNMLLEVRENANVVASVDATIGTYNDTAFISAANLLAAGAEYFVPAATVGAYAAVAEIALTALFNPGATDELHEITEGEFWVWASISRRADRELQV